MAQGVARGRACKPARVMVAGYPQDTRSTTSPLPRWWALCSQTPRHRMVSAAKRSPHPGSAVKPGRADFLLVTLAQGFRGTAKPPSEAPAREGRACGVGAAVPAPHSRSSPR